MKRPLTQADLARLIGVGEKQLSRYECGRRRPSLQAALRLWATLGIPPQALFPEFADEARAFVEERLAECTEGTPVPSRQLSIYDEPVKL